MGNLANDAANKLLNLLFDKASGAPYNKMYVGLSTTTPSADGTGVTEPSASAYRRMVIYRHGDSYTLLQKMGTAANGSISNNNSAHELGGKIIFDTMQENDSWGTITHLVFYDAETGGNLIAFAALTNSITLTAGYHIQIPAGGLVFTLS